MGAHTDAGPAVGAKPGIPDYPAILLGEGPRRTSGDTEPAMNTGPSRFRVMAIFAVKVTALEKYHGTVPRTVHGTGREDFCHKTKGLIHRNPKTEAADPEHPDY